MIRFKKLYENYNCFTIDRSRNLRCCLYTVVRVVTHFLCYNKLQDFLATFTPLCLTNINTYHIKCTYYKVMENFISRRWEMSRCRTKGKPLFKKKCFPVQLFCQFNVIKNNLHLLTVEFVFQHTYFTPYLWRVQLSVYYTWLLIN